MCSAPRVNKVCSSRHSARLLAKQGYINARPTASSTCQLAPLCRSQIPSSGSPAFHQQFAVCASPDPPHPPRTLRWFLPLNSSTRSISHTHARLMPLRSFAAGFYFFGISPTSPDCPKKHPARRVAFRLHGRLSQLTNHLAALFSCCGLFFGFGHLLSSDRCAKVWSQKRQLRMYSSDPATIFFAPVQSWSLVGGVSVLFVRKLRSCEVEYRIFA